MLNRVNASGIWYGLGAYLAWGLFPIYWKLIEQVPAAQLIGHRIVWSFLTLLLVILLSNQWRGLRAAIANVRVLRLYVVAAVLITINWFTYVWGVNSGYIVETSLGYFINPLVSVVFGVMIFGERLRPLQWMAVALAACGVSYLTIAYGTLPWIALVLAFSFGIYGVVKKLAPLGSMYGLTVETAIVLVPAVVYLLYSESLGRGAFLHVEAVSNILLIGTGVVTTVPLLLFASAVRRTELSTMGVLQYISPTLQLLLGVVVYREPFTSTQLVGFAIVWAALLVFGLDGVLARGAAKTAVIDEGAG
jgi:chloramphenicol-sensitive protein RarD